MADPRVATRPDDARSLFDKRLAARVKDRANLAIVPVIAVFCAMRPLHLISDLPYWEIVFLVVVAALVNTFAAALWADARAGWRLACRVGVEMAVIAAVVYGIGWGPMLAVGFVFAAADGMRSTGSAVAKPAIAWTVLFIGLGQLAIGIGLSPSLVGPPLVHGLGALAALGAVVTIKLLEWSTTAREASEGRFRSLVQHSTDIVSVVDASGRLTYASPAFARVLGWRPTDLASRRPERLVDAGDLERLRSEIPGVLAYPGRSLKTELRLRHADGSWRWFEATLTNQLPDPHVRGIVGNLRDITDRKVAEEALREAHERFRSAFENAPIGMAITDLEGNILRVNRAYGEIVGRGVEELSSTSVMELTHPDGREAGAAETRRIVEHRSDRYRLETRYLHSAGGTIWVSVSVSCVRDETSRPLYLIAQVEDITERHALREHLAHAALHDSLTSLPNRLLFMDRLETALDRSARRRGLVAVVFLDLDRFKLVNDSLGHDQGDQLLRAVAGRVRSSVRPGDTVARLGGDEFTVLCDEVPSEADALELARRISSGLEAPLDVQGAEVFVTASLGVALGRHPTSPERLLRDADTAMYRAKERGRASIELFDDRNDIWSVGRLRTGNDLHVAIQQDQFELHYQPFVELTRNEMVGVEALVRWRHPTRGLLLPTDFIDLAEDTGLIVPIGARVLEEACRQVAAWSRKSLAATGHGWEFGMAVNVSPRQLADRSFPSALCETILEAKLDPDCIWLEITESTLLHDPDQTIAALRRLRDEGLHLSVDDFGTGYSSLSYLQRLPVECLKIDRSFVERLGRDSESSAIFKAVMALADSLDLVCIAEGVETSSQLQWVRRLGCRVAQGYLFGRPLPAAQLGHYPAADLSSWSAAFETTA